METQQVVVKLTPAQCAQLWQRANTAGREAVARLEVRPMTVLGEGGEQWFVEDGVCGFAWIVVRPANCAFAKYMAAEHDCRKAYEGGMQLWVSDYNQSMQKKEAYARAFAQVLREAGLRASYGSRMD